MLRVESSKKLHFFGLISVGYHLELEQGRSCIQKKCFGILKPYDIWYPQMVKWEHVWVNVIWLLLYIQELEGLRPMMYKLCYWSRNWSWSRLNVHEGPKKLE